MNFDFFNGLISSWISCFSGYLFLQIIKSASDLITFLFFLFHFLFKISIHFRILLMSLFEVKPSLMHLGESVKIFVLIHGHFAASFYIHFRRFNFKWFNPLHEIIVDLFQKYFLSFSLCYCSLKLFSDLFISRCLLFVIDFTLRFYKLLFLWLNLFWFDRLHRWYKHLLQMLLNQNVLNFFSFSPFDLWKLKHCLFEGRFRKFNQKWSHFHIKILEIQFRTILFPIAYRIRVCSSINLNKMTCFKWIRTLKPDCKLFGCFRIGHFIRQY